MTHAVVDVRRVLAELREDGPGIDGDHTATETRWPGVDANDGAKRFYEGFGFMPLADRPMQLFLRLGHGALRGPAE